MRAIPVTACLTLISLASIIASEAGAEILDPPGFGNFSPADWSVNYSDAGSAPTIVPDSIQLINGSYENRSIFSTHPQDVLVGFTAGFTYQATGSNYGDTGAAFVIQNSAGGSKAFSDSYFSGKANSVEIPLYLGGATGYFTNGNTGATIPISTVNLLSGDPIDVVVSYDGNMLTESLSDAKAGTAFTTTFLVQNPISTVIGSPSGYVGFSAGSSFYGNTQTFSKFYFHSVPEPSSIMLASFGFVVLLCFWRRSNKIPLAVSPATATECT